MIAAPTTAIEEAVTAALHDVITTMGVNCPIASIRAAVISLTSEWGICALHGAQFLYWPLLERFMLASTAIPIAAHGEITPCVVVPLCGLVYQSNPSTRQERYDRAALETENFTTDPVKHVWEDRYEK